MSRLERKRRLLAAVVEFTGTGTIYRKSIRTVHLRVDRSRISGKTITLESLGEDTQSVCEILRAIFGRLDEGQEHLVMLTFDLSGSLKGFKVIASGTQHKVEIDEALVYRNALMLGAASIVLAHNHPSEEVEPSVHDLETTQTLAKIGWDLKVTLLDHMILTSTKCLSIHSMYPALFTPPFGKIN